MNLQRPEKRFTFKIFKTVDDMVGQRALLIQLNPGLEKQDLGNLFGEMVKNGYKMAGVFDGNVCIGISGYWISTKLYCGKYVELDNVVIDANYRGSGAGKILCDGILNEAGKDGCITAMLDAYLENESAHRFYEREGFVKKGYHFMKPI